MFTDLHGSLVSFGTCSAVVISSLGSKRSESNPIIDVLGSPQAKAVPAGIAAMAVKRVMQVRPEPRSACVRPA